MKKIITRIISGIILPALLILAVPAFAAESSHPKPNEAIIEVHGIVCSFCSQGVTRKLAKLPFIDASKYTKGVKVEIEQQKVTIAIKRGTTLDIKEVFDSIRSSGYEPIKATIYQDEKIITRNGGE